MAIKIFTVRMLLGRSKKNDSLTRRARNKDGCWMEAGIDLKKKKGEQKGCFSRPCRLVNRLPKPKD